LLKQGQFGPQFQVQGVVPSPTILLVRKLDEQSFMWCKNVCTRFFHSRVWQTDRRTDVMLMA